MTAPVGTEFDPGLLGTRCWLERPGGDRVELPVHRWRGAVSPGDELLLDTCAGPTVDIGCGPGRLTTALTSRGIPALGIDTSPVAVRLTRARGGAALRRDVFDRLPGEGRWSHALLADGNIGIGGDPVTLLRRVTSLLAPGGTVVADIDPPGTGLRRDRVRLRPASGAAARWFPWAWLGADAVAEVATRAGLRLSRLDHDHHRWVVALARR
ncbi:class I SAM-dependent methyltransferase [Actinokineospora auranticolor]|uniref:Methyltransferase family protein n=1 Tax=Actinokineospora auranticolor TaxID=155976 RepID=A0A2S6GLS1_9PSEU|nr:class I SAM-dependent methyltransferase [Actinokineospora auranticolor]PPK66130.1 methyltransferase family protein [Actinokineospora auranticolor]